MQIVGSVDLPRAGSTLPAAEFYIGGWVFKTNDGRQPAALFIGYEEVGGQGRRIAAPRMTVQGGVLRQDVYDMFHPSCAAVTPNSGYNITLAPPPSGTWRVSVSWADVDSGVTWYDVRTVTVTP
jgi:hypothetical protein